MQRVLGLILGILLLGVGVVAAQQSLEQCKHTVATGVTEPDGTDVTVTVAATTVISPDVSLCGAIVTNLSQIDAVRCSQTGVDPTALTGYKLLPYQVWSLAGDASIGIRCIRDSTALNDVPLTVLEYRP
jgi:hypothetical protein